MKSFVDMFVPARYSCNDKRSALVPRSFSKVPCLRPSGAADAVVQVADINNCKFTHDNLSAMSLLVIDITFLEVRNCELVVNSHINKALSYVFMRPYNWDKIQALNAGINQAIDHGVIGMMAKYYIQSC